MDLPDNRLRCIQVFWLSSASAHQQQNQQGILTCGQSHHPSEYPILQRGQVCPGRELRGIADGARRGLCRLLGAASFTQGFQQFVVRENLAERAGISRATLQKIMRRPPFYTHS